MVCVYVFMPNLAGPSFVRGAAYGLHPWLLAKWFVFGDALNDVEKLLS